MRLNLKSCSSGYKKKETILESKIQIADICLFVSNKRNIVRHLLSHYENDWLIFIFCESMEDEFALCWNNFQVCFSSDVGRTSCVLRFM